MLAVNKSTRIRQWRAVNGIHIQHFKQNTRAGDINDGIDSANLVEVNLFLRRAVDFGFRLRQVFENGGCPFDHACRKAACSIDFMDV